MILRKPKFHLLSSALWAVSFLAPVGAWSQGAGGKSGSTVEARKGKPYLNCQEVRFVVNQFLDQHHSWRTFDAELSKRTFKRLFDNLDASHSWFLSSDIEGFRQWETRLNSLIGKADCRFLQEIRQTYGQRVQERLKQVEALLATPFAFDVPETLNTGKVGWPQTAEEAQERLRKRLKFQVLNTKSFDGEAAARERIRKRYEAMGQQSQTLGGDELYSLFLNSFAQALDPHSAHLLPAEQESFTNRLSNSFEGIGVQLREEGGSVSVEGLIPGGAAIRSGRVRPGDRILAVDPGDGSGMVNVIDMDLSRTSTLLRGKKGTKVTIVLMRRGDKGMERFSVVLTRDVVNTHETEARGDVMVLGNKRIGVLKIPSFYIDLTCRARTNASDCHDVTSDSAREIKKLIGQKIDGLVVDVRGNPGGDFPSSVSLSSLFLTEGYAVQTVDRQRNIRPFPIFNNWFLYGGPMAVVVSRSSASAAEIFAGAMQDYGRALIVGDVATYGKGTVQKVMDITTSDQKEAAGALKVTYARFYRPSGKSNQEKGVVADVVIPSLSGALDISERDNDFVIPWDAIRPVTGFSAVIKWAEHLAKLRLKSKNRIESSPSFQKMLERSESIRRERDKSEVSLMEGPEGRSTPGPNEEMDLDPTTSAAVVRESDFQLKEAGWILIDAMDAVGKNTQWVGKPAGGAQR